MVRYWYDSNCAQHKAFMANLDALRTKSATVDPKPKVLISVITLGEIEFGHRVQLGDHAKENADRLRFLKQELPAPFELTRDAAEAYAELRSRLFAKYVPQDKRKPKMRPEQLVDPATAKELQIQENDLWICAQALAHDMVLVTNDRMKPIVDSSAGLQPPLRIENWTMPPR
jgi:predicted nucleic acid-binding protein